MALKISAHEPNILFRTTFIFFFFFFFELETEKESGAVGGSRREREKERSGERGEDRRGQAGGW